MSKKQQKDIDANPPKGDGNGLERAYSKNNFTNNGYNIRELIYQKLLGPYIR